MLKKSLLALAFSTITFPALGQTFVDSQWLKAHPEAVVVDMDDFEQYQRFHLPNAIWVNYAWLIRPQNGLQLSGGPSYTALVLSKLGIRPNDKVVIYDDSGDLNAARLYWEMKKINHVEVYLLQGGLVKWILDGHGVTQKPNRLTEERYLAPFNNLTDAYTADKDDVKAALEDGKTLLIDVRSKEEFDGDPKDPRSGHLPGAIHFEWNETLAADEGFVEKSESYLLNALAGLDIVQKKQPIIVYCNTGHRAARFWVSLINLGFENVKLYDGSMQEWSLDSKLPVEKTPVQNPSELKP